MSTMAIKLILKPAANMALTAMFHDLSLRFVKTFSCILKDRGTCHSSDLSLFVFVHRTKAMPLITRKACVFCSTRLMCKSSGSGGGMSVSVPSLLPHYNRLYL